MGKRERSLLSDDPALAKYKPSEKYFLLLPVRAGSSAEGAYCEMMGSVGDEICQGFL